MAYAHCNFAWPHHEQLILLLVGERWMRSCPRCTIERKLGNLRETYAMLNTEAQAARAELLEIIIVVLIVAELMLAILRR